MSGGSSVWTVRLTDTAAEDFKSSSGSKPHLGHVADEERAAVRARWT